MPCAFHLAVRDIVNKVDPMGLVAMGAPDDEYDDLVRALIKWRRPVTPDQVRQVLSADVRLTPDEAQRVAAEINSAAQELGT